MVGVWTVVCFAASGGGGEPGSPFAGVYVTTPALTDGGRSVPESVYRLPQVDGIYIRLVWNAVEPAANGYDWTTLDAQLDRAVPAGKKLAIGIGAGAFTPAWIYELGAPGATFVIAPRGGANGYCRTAKIPAPWAAQYQAAYGELMTALAAHLKSRPGAYAAARIIKMTAINEATEETRMPASNGRRVGEGGCSQSDAVSAWRSLGYRPSKIIQAWTSMAGAVDRAFPDKLIGMPILETNDFPLIDEKGEPASRDDPAASGVKRQLILAGLRIFEGRFAVQWNGLQANKVSQTVLWAGANGAVIGWQTNEHRGSDGAGCGGPGDPKAVCTETAYEAILVNGVDHGAQYLEIWPPGALRFPGPVARASLRLKSGADRPRASR